MDEADDESGFGPDALVSLSPFPSSISPSPRRLSSSFTLPARSVRAARQLAWVSLQGRLVGAEEAGSARAIDCGGGLSPEEAVAWDLFSPFHRFLIVAVIAAAAVNSKKNKQIYQLTKSVQIRDEVLSSMQQKLDNLCEQVNYFRDQPEVTAYNFKSSGCGCRLCDHHSPSSHLAISGDMASPTVNAGSLSELSDVANVSLYGFEDYHGVDIGVVRAVRLWYSPLAGEISVKIKLREGDMKLGFAISRTEEGFIYVSSVIADDDNAPSSRSGLSTLYKEATRACRLLIVSRVSNQKVLPWMVPTTGAVRCFDTVSMSQKLSLHRHAHVPIILHVFSWDRDLSYFHVPSRPSTSPSTISSVPMALPPEIQLAHFTNSNQVVLLPSSEIPPPENRVPNDGPVTGLARDTAGESSFRFHDFVLPNNWV